MATRFLAIISNKPGGPKVSPSDIACRLGLPCLIDAGSLQVFTSEGDALVLPGSGGVIVGALFSRPPNSQFVTSMSTDLAAQISRSGGKALIQSYWGGYIALLTNQLTEVTQVLRDPSGALPCYLLSVAGATLVFSDIQILVQSGLHRPALNWEFIPRHLYSFDLRTPDTGLRNVFELLAGFRLSIRGVHVSTEAIWSPWDHVSPDGRPDEILSNTLKTVVTDCTRAWATRFRKILLSVSGGLDSSIVASVLAADRTSVQCVTLSTNEPEGDESDYARQLTTGLGLSLEAEMYRLCDIDITKSTSAFLPRPMQSAFGQAVRRIKFGIAERDHIDAFFGGIGGDNVFCHTRSATPLVDQILANGANGQTWRTLDDICRMTGNSAFDVLKMAWGRMRTGNASYHWRGTPGYLNPKLIPEFVLTHPWLVTPRHALPGKAVHVAMLARMQGTIDGFERERPPQIDPLLSQPIVEACLHIPSWRWVSHGQDRSIARLAFADQIPAGLGQRRSKGGPDAFAYQLVEANKTILREFLLGGLIAQQGVLDLTSLEQALTPHGIIRSPHHVQLLGLAEAEAWARHWS